jgi:hypothetical protein
MAAAALREMEVGRRLAGEITDGDEPLAGSVRRFVFAALLWYRMGRGDIAISLMRDAVRFAVSETRRAENMNWLRMMLQPAINAARVYRSFGRHRRCLALLESIYRVACEGKPARLLGTDVDSALSGAFPRDDPATTRLVLTCRRIETLKCALAAGRSDEIEDLLVRKTCPEQTVAAFELECRLKVLLWNGDGRAVLEQVALQTVDELWPYLYAIDALALVGCRDESRALALQLVSRAPEQANSERLARLLHATAYRLWVLGAPEADDVCDTAEAIAERADSEVVRIRVATLRVLCAKRTGRQNELEASERLWPCLQQSHYAAEKAVACLVASLSGDSPERRFEFAARQEIQAMRPRPILFQEMYGVLFSRREATTRPVASLLDAAPLANLFLRRVREITLVDHPAAASDAAHHTLSASTGARASV